MPVTIFGFFQVEIDSRQVTGPAIGLGQQDATDHQRRYLAMRMTQQNHVDTGNLSRDRDCRVLVGHLRGIQFPAAQVFFDTHVHRDYDHVDFFFLAQDWPKRKRR